MSDPSCVFCKIVAGGIPALRVYEDADILAFLDVNPLAEGHLLIIPKPHIERLEEMSPDLIGQLARQLPRLAAAVAKATGVAGYNLLQNNGAVASQEVSHVHFHIIPRTQGDGLGYRWNAGSYPPGRAEQIQQRLSEALAGS